MYAGQRVAVLIPALDEAEAIGPVLDAIDRSVVDRIIVGDNGSTDATAAVARARGAEVVREERRGYGSACQRAAAAAPDVDILVFLDADGSDDPGEISLLLASLTNGNDFVVGSRVAGHAEPGSLTPLQTFGNALTCFLVRRLWGVRYTDLGPFRAIWRRHYDALGMSDPDFGWTIEMQVKAAQRRLRVAEVPVTYHPRRAGQSKVSGTIRGSYGAGKRILGYVAAAKLAELRGRRRSDEQHPSDGHPRSDVLRQTGGRPHTDEQHPSDGREQPRGPRPSRRLIVGLLVALAALLSLRLPLWLLPGPGRDEAAYHYWAHHPEPAIAPLLQLAVRIFELPLGPSLLALRAPVVLLGVLIPVLHDLRLRRSAAPVSTRVLHVGLLLVTPWQCFTGSILHPDAFLVAALLALVLAARDGRVLFAAAAAAFAALAKPTGLLVLPVAWWLLGALRTGRRGRVWAGRALLVLAALPFLTNVDPDLLEGIGQFGRAAEEVPMGTRLGAWLASFLFLAGPLLPALACLGFLERIRGMRGEVGSRERMRRLRSEVGFRERMRRLRRDVASPSPERSSSVGPGLRSTLEHTPEQRRESLATLSVAVVLIAVFAGAALFRGQFKGNWMLPAAVLLLPLGVVRMSRPLLGAGLALTLVGSIVQAAVLWNPERAARLEARLPWAAQTAGAYSVHAGAREARVSVAGTWAERFAEYGDGAEFARSVDEAWRANRTAWITPSGQSATDARPTVVDGLPDPAEPFRYLVSDDYGLAMQLHWYLGHDRLRVAVPTDGVFRRAAWATFGDAGSEPILVLAVHGPVEGIAEEIDVRERLGSVAHPITGQPIELGSARVLRSR